MIMNIKGTRAVYVQAFYDVIALLEPNQHRNALQLYLH